MHSPGKAGYPVCVSLQNQVSLHRLKRPGHQNGFGSRSFWPLRILDMENWWGNLDAFLKGYTVLASFYWGYHGWIDSWNTLTLIMRKYK